MNYEATKPGCGIRVIPVNAVQNPAIVIPAYNEGATVDRLLREIRAVTGCPVYLADDASVDDTAAIAHAAGATVLPLASQLGAWGATQAGIRFALKAGHDAVVTMDADGQHDPRHFETLLAPLREGVADVCIGAWPQRGSPLRRIAWTLLRVSSGIALEDLTSGLRAYNRSAMTVAASWQATFLDFQDVGVLALLLRNGARIVDVDTPMRARQSGASRVFSSWIVVALYMLHTLVLGISKRRIMPYKATATAPDCGSGEFERKRVKT